MRTPPDLHPDDALRFDVRDGAQVSVESRHSRARLIARVGEQTAPGQVFCSFHFPASGVNRLTSDHADTVTSWPEYKVTAVRLAAPYRRRSRRDRPAPGNAHLCLHGQRRGGRLRVPIVLARIYDPGRPDIYRELGIPTIASVRWTVHQIHRMLLHHHLTRELSFGNGETLLIRSELPAYLTGRRLTEFDVDGEIRVVEVTRAGRSLVPSHGIPAEPGDLVTFAIAATALGRLRGFLDKELGT